MIFKFRLIFAIDELMIMLGMGFHCCVLGKSIDLCQQKKHGSTGFPQAFSWKAIPDIILCSSVTKIEWNLKMTIFQEMSIEWKITQPNLMILVSFSSTEDVWSNDINKYNTFSSQCTENPPFLFFWDTRYIWPPFKKDKQLWNYNYIITILLTFSVQVMFSNSTCEDLALLPAMCF